MFDIIDSMDEFEGMRSFYDRENDEIVSVLVESLGAAEELEDDADLEEVARRTAHGVIEEVELAIRIANADRSMFVPVPSRRDFNEYAIMCDFVDTLPDGSIRDRLANGLRGSGAFGRFRDGIYYYDIADAWYRFRAKRFAAAALDWSRDNNVSVTLTEEEADTVQLVELARELTARAEAEAAETPIN